MIRRSALSLEIVKRSVLPIVTAIVGVCLIGLLVYGVSHQSANRTLDEQIARGTPPQAPDATKPLPVLGSSGSRTLASLKGKVVLLNIWASWCITCQEEAPLLENAQSAMLAHNSTIVGITDLDASPDSQTFVRQYHLTYPNLRDNTGSFAHAYGTAQLPESFLIDRQGRIVAIERGPVGQAFLKRATALAAHTA
jgi:cytochrome c biogenesis protein CcmG, thiol:disulfide interchange protein DsbE